MRQPKFKIGDDVVIHNPMQSYDGKVATIVGCIWYDTCVKYDVKLHDYNGMLRRVKIYEENLTLLYYPAKTGEGKTMNFIELYLRYGGAVYVNASNITGIRQVIDDTNGKVLYTKVCMAGTEDYRVRETPDEIFEKMRKSMAVNVF